MVTGMPLKYKCYYPNCTYETNNRSLIELHHIKPKELDSSPLNKVTIPLCPTCHKLVYHPLVESGQHALNTEKSIQILGVYKSTQGDSLHYMDYKGNKYYYFPVDRTTWND